LLNEDEDTQTLSKLGLTNAEARVYLALVKNGPSKAPDAAKDSEVARPDVYRTISKLQELGLVERIVSSPNEYRAIPIFDALSILFQRREKEHTELTEKVDILLEKYNALQKNVSKEKSNQFILIPEKETLIHERRKAMENAKQEIIIMIPLKKLGPAISNSPEAFSNPLDRKVNIRIITEKPEDEAIIDKVIAGLHKNHYFEIRTLPPPIPANFGIYDTKEILLSTSSKSVFAGAPDIWSNNPDIIELALDYFNIKWAIATPKKALKKTEKGKRKFSQKSGKASLNKY
jgi:sugar-specific transcriptional regulator TrmB